MQYPRVVVSHGRAWVGVGGGLLDITQPDARARIAGPAEQPVTGWELHRSEPRRPVGGIPAVAIASSGGYSGRLGQPVPLIALPSQSTAVQEAALGQDTPVKPYPVCTWGSM